MSSEETRQSVNTAGSVIPIDGIEAAGWAVYFGKGDPLNRAGVVSQGQPTKDNASLIAVIEALRIMRKQHASGSYFRILTESPEVSQIAEDSGASGQAKILQEELELAKKHGLDILVDELKGPERSKEHDEAVAMATHEAQNYKRGHGH